MRPKSPVVVALLFPVLRQRTCPQLKTTLPGDSNLVRARRPLTIVLSQFLLTPLISLSAQPS